MNNEPGGGDRRTRPRGGRALALTAALALAAAGCAKDTSTSGNTTTTARQTPIPGGDHAPLFGVKWGEVSGLSGEALCAASPPFQGYSELKNQPDKSKWPKAAAVTVQTDVLNAARARGLTPAVVYANPPAMNKPAGMEAAELTTPPVADPDKAPKTAQGAVRIGAEVVCFAGILTTISDETLTRTYKFEEFMSAQVDGPGDVDLATRTLQGTTTPVS